MSKPSSRLLADRLTFYYYSYKDFDVEHKDLANMLMPIRLLGKYAHKKKHQPKMIEINE